ncbi:MAG: hypothetical protein ACR2JA_06475, partial [Hydrogenophaga sp.]|uniref:hypothetical protein n=1 Tax=Hydrogenophaga sp. TaxID=1904254 RepID=UPI003D9B1B33
SWSMDTKPSPTHRQVVVIPDAMRHFSRDGPFVRLLALLIIKLPLILAASAGPVYWLGRTLGWWE